MITLCMTRIPTSENTLDTLYLTRIPASKNTLNMYVPVRAFLLIGNFILCHPNRYQFVVTLVKHTDNIRLNFEKPFIVPLKQILVQTWIMRQLLVHVPEARYSGLVVSLVVRCRLHGLWVSSWVHEKDTACKELQMKYTCVSYDILCRTPGNMTFLLGNF